MRYGNSYYSEKKRHSMKAQIIYDLTAHKIVSFYISNGKTHDCKMFKESGQRFRELIKGAADSAYQRILKVWHSVETPFKKPCGGELSDDEKAFNSLLGSVRIAIEHINAWLKRFRMIKDRYRGNIKDLEISKAYGKSFFLRAPPSTLNVPASDFPPLLILFSPFLRSCNRSNHVQDHSGFFLGRFRPGHGVEKALNIVGRDVLNRLVAESRNEIPIQLPTVRRGGGGFDVG